MDYVERSLSEAEGEKQFLEYAIIHCSGYAACVAAGFSNEDAVYGCGPDFEKAGHRLEAAKAKAIDLMTQQKNINAVRILADKLLEFGFVDYDHADVLMDLADGKTNESEYEQYLTLRRMSEADQFRGQ